MTFWRVSKIAKKKEATNGFVKSVRPSARLSGFHRAYFHEILYLSIFRKSVEKIQVSLKSDKNNGYFARRPIYISDYISFSCGTGSSVGIANELGAGRSGIEYR